MGPYVTVESIIATCKDMLRLSDTTAPDSILETHIINGYRSIKSISHTITKTEEVDVVDGVIEYPVDFHRYVALYLGGHKYIHVDPSFGEVLSGDCTCGSYTDGTFRLGKCGIELNSIIEDTKATLIYKAFLLDEFGMRCIPEDTALALIPYACYEYGNSYPNTQVDSSGYTSSQVENWRKAWVAKKSWVIGQAVKDNARLDRGAIMASVNAVLTVKRR